MTQTLFTVDGGSMPPSGRRLSPAPRCARPLRGFSCEPRRAIGGRDVEVALAGIVGPEFAGRELNHDAAC
jgi:hypothetical protein